MTDQEMGTKVMQTTTDTTEERLMDTMPTTTETMEERSMHAMPMMFQALQARGVDYTYQAATNCFQFLLPGLEVTVYGDSSCKMTVHAEEQEALRLLAWLEQTGGVYQAHSERRLAENGEATDD